MEERKNIKIAVVEDDNYFNHLLTKYVCAICESLQYNGFSFEIKAYPSANQCLDDLKPDVDFMILDYYLDHSHDPDTLTGEGVIEEVKKFCPRCKIIVVSALKTISKAKELLDLGIYDYVDKNVNSSIKIGSILQEGIREKISTRTFF